MAVTRLRSVIAAFAVLLSIFLVTHVSNFPGSIPYLMETTHGQKILDMQASFSSAETYERLEAFGESGRRMYMRTMLTVDLIFPISVFVFLFLLSKYTSERLRMRPLWTSVLWSLPIAYVSFDFVENVAVAILLSHFPDRLEFLGSHIGYLTVGKRISMFGALLIPLALWSIASVSRLLQVYRR